MRVEELTDVLPLKVINLSQEGKEMNITDGYVSDLLSDVMGHLEEGMVWFTIQTHRNVIAVATLKEAAAVILVQDAELDEEALEMAKQEGLCVFSTALPTFAAAGKLYNAIQGEEAESYQNC